MTVSNQSLKRAVLCTAVKNGQRKTGVCSGVVRMSEQVTGGFFHGRIKADQWLQHQG